MRIPAVAFFVLLCLSGCAAKPAAEIPEPEPGMQLVECASSKESYSSISAYIQIPEDWKMEQETIVPISPGGIRYSFYIKNNEDTGWVSSGELTLFGDSDYLEQNSEVKEGILINIDDIKSSIENAEGAQIFLMEEFESNGYPAIELDYSYDNSDSRTHEIYVTNESNDQKYFSVYLRMYTNIADEETADKILDSLVIAE